jgi:periplasmic copper chaperone A
MKRTFMIAAVLIAAVVAGGKPNAATSIAIADPWVAPPVGKRTMTAGFLTLTNSGADTALVSASSPDVKRLELHMMEEKGGMMSMKMVERIDLPRNRAVKLHPGGLHLMLIGLNRTIAAGDVVKVTLRFADGSTRELAMPVRDREEG